MMSRAPFRLFESNECFYLVHVTGGITSSIIRLQRTTDPPNSLGSILSMNPAISIEQIISCSRCVAEAHAVLGFIQFLGFFYVILCTKKEICGSINSHDVYSITASQMVPITPSPLHGSNFFMNCLSQFNRAFNQTSAESAERKYHTLFQCVDLSKEFYFSSSYDITRSMQSNIMSPTDGPGDNDRFIWNHHLNSSWSSLLTPQQRNIWLVSIVHGFYQQKRFSSFGKMVDVILIARRSRHYAGTRYLKRGLNEKGHVANDCEIEIILQLDSPSSPSAARPAVASFCQMRGSVPLYWSQETSVTVPRPPIVLHKADPSYEATQKHFLDMFERYGKPILVLDLVKQSERRRRESIIGNEFFNAVEELNSCIPEDMQILFCGLDFSGMSAAAKQSLYDTGGKYFSDIGGISGDAFDIIPVAYEEEIDIPRAETDYPKNTENGGGKIPREKSILEELDALAYYSIHKTGFFCTYNILLHNLELSFVLIVCNSKVNRLRNVKGFSAETQEEAAQRKVVIQRGVMRTNCVDCLDRTNVAQFALGVRFLSTGLFALGLGESTVLHSSSPMLKAFVLMFSDMGDKLAMQYGGSEAHKRVANSHTVASSGQAISSQGELLTSIKRYYSNAFTDRMKQDAINLFLGAYIPLDHSIALWDFDSDYHLHHLSKETFDYNENDDEEVIFGGCSRSSNVTTLSDEAIILRELEALNEDELVNHPLFTRYAVSYEKGKFRGQRHRQMLSLIAESETRKQKFRKLMVDAIDAECNMWRSSIRKFSSSLKGCTALITSASPAISLDWTSFDETLAIKSNIPVPTSSAQAYFEDEESLPIQASASSNVSPKSEGSSCEHSVESDLLIDCKRQTSDDVGAVLGQYVRGISARAGALVGFLSPRVDESVVKPPAREISTDPLYVKSSKSGWSDRSIEDMAALYGVDSASARLYSQYTKEECPVSLKCTGDTDHSAKSFYEKSLAGSILNCDDIISMEKFAASQGIYHLIREGSYSGMSVSEPSSLNTGIVHLNAAFFDSVILPSSSSARLDILLDARSSKQLLYPGQRDDLVNLLNQQVNKLQLFEKAVHPELCKWNSVIDNILIDSEENFQPETQAGFIAFDVIPGFIKSRNSRYERLDNSHFFMNKIGAKSFSVFLSHTI